MFYAVKNRTAHGGEDCAARRVKTKADALGIGGELTEALPLFFAI